MDNLTKNLLNDFSIEKARNLAEMNMPLGLVVPRADVLLSHYSLINGLSIEQCVDHFYKDGLNAYLKKMNSQNLLGKYGSVVSPISYICRFNNMNVDYYWIPKNACTFFKKNLALLELECRGDEVGFEPPKGEFHETVQQTFGLGLKAYLANEPNNKKVTIIREPTERLVSCYIDKFAKPCITKTDYEPYIKTIITNIYSYFSITATPEVRSISFSEFLSYINLMPKFSSNEHWRPQADFIRNIDFDYIFTQESLLDQASEQGLLHKSVTSRLNSSVGLTYTAGKYEGEYSEVLPRNINLAEIKDYSQFVTNSSRKVIEKTYSEDIELYKINGVL